MTVGKYIPAKNWRERLKALKNGFMDADLARMSWPQRLGLNTARIVYALIRDLRQGQLSLRAMSLVYTTLITLVPLLAISFSVLKGFGVHNRVEPFVKRMLEGLGPEKADEVSNRIISFVDNIEVGVLGAVGLGLLIYIVINLMQKIEAAFNDIWRVGRSRTMAQRFSDYLSVLLVGPLLIFLSAGITASVRNSDMVEYIADIGLLGPAFDWLGFLVPWLILALAFSFIFVFMPNTKVRLGPALIGGIIAALIWKFMGWVFSSFIASSASYVAIYAAFATLIVFMIWLYLSWLVILIGATIAFYVQNPRYVRVGREPPVLSSRMHTGLGLGALALIANAHYHRTPQWNLEGLTRYFNVPVAVMQKVMEPLVSGGIVLVNREDDSYHPACPFERTTIAEVLDCLEHYGETPGLNLDKLPLPQSAAQCLQTIRDSRAAIPGEYTIYQALLINV
jgi:membrane protein